MHTITIGIDISKKHFDASLYENNKHKNKKFNNNKSGFKSLKDWIVKYDIGKIHVCLESTGFYGESLSESLHKDGYKVSVVNPSCIKSYARSKLCRHKTDKIDAQLIAEYCEKYSPTLWKPLPSEIKQIRELSRCIDALKLQYSQITNQLENTGHSESVAEVWEDLGVQIKEKIKSLYKKVDELLSETSHFNEAYDNLQTIPGIGKTTAITLLAEIPDINNFKNSRQLTAYAGLTPSQKFSGSSVKGKPRLSKIGSGRLRKAMFFPALVAKKHNVILKDFCENLKNKGKHAFCIVGAAMRKLLQIVFVVLKNKTVFNHNI